MHGCKMIIFFGWTVFRGYVSFMECNGEGTTEPLQHRRSHLEQVEIELESKKQPVLVRRGVLTYVAYGKLGHANT